MSVNGILTIISSLACRNSEANCTCDLIPRQRPFAVGKADVPLGKPDVPIRDSSRARFATLQHWNSPAVGIRKPSGRHPLNQSEVDAKPKISPSRQQPLGLNLQPATRASAADSQSPLREWQARCRREFRPRSPIPFRPRPVPNQRGSTPPHSTG